MPSFDDSVVTRAAPEEVWKILYDPYRFPEWWTAVGSVDDATEATSGETSFTVYPVDYPDFPMPQSMRTASDGSRVVVSCLVSDLTFEWILEDGGDGDSTRISVHVDVPEAEAHRLETQRDVIAASLAGLAELAARS
jgi:uncharacterized protein YndB with AHSA1/START domain